MMNEMQQRAFAGVIRTLDAIGCQYRILKPDGEEVVTFPVEPEKPKRQKKHDLPYGALTPACQQMIGDMYPGEYRAVRLSDFLYPLIPAEVFANAMSSTAYKLWGRGRYRTMTNAEWLSDCVVDVYRLGDDE